jgi:hypothetical protein
MAASSLRDRAPPSEEAVISLSPEDLHERAMLRILLGPGSSVEIPTSANRLSIRLMSSAPFANNLELSTSKYASPTAAAQIAALESLNERLVVENERLRDCATSVQASFDALRVQVFYCAEARPPAAPVMRDFASDDNRIDPESRNSSSKLQECLALSCRGKTARSAATAADDSAWVASDAVASAERSLTHVQHMADTAQSFLDALNIAFQSERGRKGYAEDLRWAAGLCATTWREEQLWNGLVHVRCGEKKRTHLMYAAKKGSVARVRWLLERCAPTELKDVDGNTALSIASQLGHVDVVRLLLAFRADVNSLRNDGRTPVHFAAQMNDTETLRALIDAGANIEGASREIDSPLLIAANRGLPAVARLLIAAGSRTVVHRAAHDRAFIIAFAEIQEILEAARVQREAEARPLSVRRK